MDGVPLIGHLALDIFNKSGFHQNIVSAADNDPIIINIAKMKYAQLNM